MQFIPMLLFQDRYLPEAEPTG